MPETNPSTSSSSVANDVFSSMGGLSDSFSALMEKREQLTAPYVEKAQKAEEAYAQAKGDIGIRKAELEAASKRAGFAGEAAVYKKYDKELMTPPPTIQYSPETQESMSSLATLLPLAGMLMGGGGRLSGIGAMEAMSGVLEGHRQGNQDRIALETKNFEQKMNQWKLHIEQVKGAFERALKMASLNASSANAQLQVELAKLDAQMLKQDAARNGPVQASLKGIELADKFLNAVDQSITKMYAEKPENYTVNGQTRMMLPSEAVAMERAGATVVKTGVTSATKVSQLNDETAVYIANSYLDNPAASASLLSSRSKEDKDKILEFIAQRAKEKGISPEKLDAIRLQYTADTAAARTYGSQEARVGAAAQTASNSIAIAKEYSQKLPRGTFQTINSLIQKTDTEISDPILLGFKKSLDTLAIEYARATSPVGQPTDYKLKVAQNALSTITSEEAFDEVISVMEREIAASQKAQQQGLEYILGGKKFPSSAAPAAPSVGGTKTLPPEVVSKLKEGVQTKFKNDEIWTLTNGVPTQVQQVIYGW